MVLPFVYFEDGEGLFFVYFCFFPPASVLQLLTVDGTNGVRWWTQKRKCSLCIVLLIFAPSEGMKGESCRSQTG